MISRKLIVLVTFALVLCMVTLNCQQEKIKKVNNISPKFQNEKFVSLEKLYSIDVTDISMIGAGHRELPYERLIDFDNNDNMYILDTIENNIVVFDNAGKRIKTLGRAGQGPEEFNQPYSMLIKEEKIYVFQSDNTYKIVNLEGEYIITQTMPWLNFFTINLIKNEFYLFEGKVEKSFTILKFVLSIRDKNFSNDRDIFTQKYSKGFKGPNYDFFWSNWILITDTGEFYFPENNFDKYLIVKYNKKGKPLLKFGRDYKIVPYSQKAEKRFNRLQEEKKREREKLPKSPPIVRRMFQDEYGYIWIISGETYLDNRDRNFENTIDIFSEEGIWLYSFKTKRIGRQLVYNDGKIYVISPIDEETYEQYIDVYNINYQG